MKKIFFTLLLASSILLHSTEVKATTSAGPSQGIAVNEAHFPDANFRTIVSNFDKDGNGVLSDTEIQSVDKITVIWSRKGKLYSKREYIGGLGQYNGIAVDFTGIEYFSNVRKLVLYNLDIKNLPFEKLSFLEEIDFDVMAKASFDFSKNKNLKEIRINSTPITSIDMGKNKKLTSLSLTYDGLKSIDVSELKNLEYLTLNGNKISKLDLSKNKKLKQLAVWENKLSKLDVSNNKYLKRLDIHGNNFARIDEKTLKVSKDCKIKSLMLYESKKLRYVDVSHLKKLTCLWVYRTPVTRLKFGNSLEELDAGSTKLVSLTAPTVDAASGSKLKNLIVNSCYKLKKIDCSQFKNLEFVFIESNKATSIDLSQNKKLEYITISNSGKLKELIATKDMSSKGKKYLKKFAKTAGISITWK